MQKPHIVTEIPHNHTDFNILAKHCGCEAWISSASGSTLTYTYEANYLRVHHLRYWTPESVEDIKSSIDSANEETTEYRFTLVDVTDYEMEFDEDRYWDASITVLAHKK